MITKLVNNGVLVSKNPNESILVDYHTQVVRHIVALCTPSMMS